MRTTMPELLLNGNSACDDARVMIRMCIHSAISSDSDIAITQPSSSNSSDMVKFRNNVRITVLIARQYSSSGQNLIGCAPIGPSIYS